MVSEQKDPVTRNSRPRRIDCLGSCVHVGRHSLPLSCISHNVCTEYIVMLLVQYGEEYNLRSRNAVFLPAKDARRR